MYIDLNDYEIYLFNAQQRFEVDFFIAKTIQLLNQKGYTTTNCCSGHGKKDIKMPCYSEETGEYVCDAEFFQNDCYIAFADGIKLPSIPKGFQKEVVEDCEIIRYTIPCDTEIKNSNTIAGTKERFKIFKKVISINKSLYNWAEKLPTLEVSKGL